ncbi:hypothetical protein A7U60_g4818 [Sanghuangporus baumii]|uniref:BTB domain-containing protein n=1 Tax=Sanghuangporus baumii TaxID=108892 RepID=A0A9Q5HXW3_SANBA|nr:hypothetical protein A7U60_g4818 [Sanghuangporus baumii]
MTTDRANPAGPNVKPRQRDDEFYINFIIFEVESILFRVPRHSFEANSETFRDMFASIPATLTAEGSSDINPLILNGVTTTDFRALVKALLSPAYGSKIELNVTEWISVLRLAHLWTFGKLLDAAIEEIDRLSSDPALKISLAKKYNVSKWLRRNYFKLVMRLEPLTASEAEMIGTQCVLKLCEIRESRFKWVLDGRIRNLWGEEPIPWGIDVHPNSQKQSEDKLPAVQIGLDPNVFSDKITASYVMQLQSAVHEAITKAFELDD